MRISCVGDAKWLLVSTEQLYGEALTSGDHGKLSRHHHKSRLPPALPSAVTPALPQCEVAFPGNRILSPSPTDGVRRKTDYLVDVHRSDVNCDASCSRELSDGDFVSGDSQTSCNVSSQLVSDFCNAEASNAASDRLNSLNITSAELGTNCEIVGNTDDDVKTAANHGIYMENGNVDSVPLEPLKAEKLATFGEHIMFSFSIIMVVHWQFWN